MKIDLSIFSNRREEHELVYFLKSWQSTRADLLVPDDSPPSAAGRPPMPIPPEVERRIVELREQGVTLEKIADVIDAKFDLRLAKSTLHALWLRLEESTPTGQRITQLRKRFGLSRAFWRRYLEKDRRREAREAGRSAPPSSDTSPTSPASASPAAESRPDQLSQTPPSIPKGPNDDANPS